MRVIVVCLDTLMTSYAWCVHPKWHSLAQSIVFPEFTPIECTNPNIFLPHCDHSPEHITVGFFTIFPHEYIVATNNRHQWCQTVVIEGLFSIFIFSIIPISLSFTSLLSIPIIHFSLKCCFFLIIHTLFSLYPDLPILFYFQLYSDPLVYYIFLLDHPLLLHLIHQFIHFAHGYSFFISLFISFNFFFIFI